MRSEDTAIEALTSLADEHADDPRVHGIVCEAIEKLRGRPCRPHWWRLPVVGDESLVCDECGRRLAFATMSGDICASVVDGFERRHGEEAGAEFRSAFYKATARPSVISQPYTSQGPSFDEQRETARKKLRASQNASRELFEVRPVPAIKGELAPQEPLTVTIKRID